MIMNRDQSPGKDGEPLYLNHLLHSANQRFDHHCIALHIELGPVSH